MGYYFNLEDSFQEIFFQGGIDLGDSCLGVQIQVIIGFEGMWIQGDLGDGDTGLGQVSGFVWVLVCGWQFWGLQVRVDIGGILLGIYGGYRQSDSFSFRFGDLDMWDRYQGIQMQGVLFLRIQLRVQIQGIEFQGEVGGLVGVLNSVELVICCGRDSGIGFKGLILRYRWASMGQRLGGSVRKFRKRGGRLVSLQGIFVCLVGGSLVFCLFGFEKWSWGFIFFGGGFDVIVIFVYF